MRGWAAVGEVGGGGGGSTGVVEDGGGGEVYCPAGFHHYGFFLIS